MNRHSMQILWFAYLLLIPALPAAAGSGDAEPAKYKHEHVVGVWQRGYLNGPAQGAMIQLNAMTMDAQGNIYTYGGRRVRVIAKDGRVWNLAGNGIQGFRDGPANTAMFNPGGSGYGYQGIAINSKGELFTSDGRNNRIRKIYKNQDGQWWVDTYAGNGTTGVGPGQKGRIETVKFGEPVAVAVDSFDNVWTQSGAGIYKMTPDGDVYCYSNTAGTAIMMQADKLGNVYLYTRYPNEAYFKVTQEGLVTRVAGMLKTETDELKKNGQAVPVDGPALASTFWSHSNFVVSGDGVIYGGNGDEFVVRRVKDGYTMTLFPDGWKTDPSSRTKGWFLGGPMYVDENGIIYLWNSNPMLQPGVRRIIPVK